MALAAVLAIVCIAKGLAISAMNLMDEDSLSDIQGQTGLSMVAKVRTSGGNIRITGTGYIDLNGITINNSNGGFAQIGNAAAPATVDVGNDGSTVKVRLQYPNGMSDTQPPSIQASTVTWSDSTGTGVNVGSLAINRIYQNQIRLTAWFHSSGLNLLAELNADIEEVATSKGTGRGLSVQHTLFSATAAGTNDNPTRGDGYLKFGGSSSMSFDIYTYDKVYSAGESGWYPGPGTADGRSRSIMRISYAVTGTFRINNGRIGSESDPTHWHNYGPIIMENMRNGEITIELPCSVGAANYVYFNPDT